jgi:hypothetical protein
MITRLAKIGNLELEHYVINCGKCSAEMEICKPLHDSLVEKDIINKNSLTDDVICVKCRKKR